MVLTQSCYVMEGCAMVLILLLPLQLVYSSWPVTTICRPTAWLGQYILANSAISPTHPVTYYFFSITVHLVVCFAWWFLLWPLPSLC